MFENNLQHSYETKFPLKAHSEQIKRKGIILPRGSAITEGSRYGYALINLGNLDSDKYEDFAVGSPFEGKGVV